MDDLESRLELKKATDEEIKSVLIESPFKKLAHKGYELYFGEQFGESTLNRNGYWHNAGTGELLFDYHFFFQNASGSLIIFGTHAKKLEEGSYSSDEEAQALGPLTKCIGNISGYLKEIVQKYDDKKLDINGSTLGIPNSTMYKDLLILVTSIGSVGAALVMRAEMPRNEKIKHNLIAQAKGLMKFYSDIEAKYERAASQSPL